MKQNTYIELLECAVLSLLAEKGNKDFSDIKIPEGVSNHPSFQPTNGKLITFSPYNLKAKIREMREKRDGESNKCFTS